MSNGVLILAAVAMGWLVGGLTLRWLAARAGGLRLVDLPRGRKRHAGPVPMVGGAAVFTGLIVGFGLEYFRDAGSVGAWGWLFVALLIAFGIGLSDDRGGKVMRPAVKALATLALLLGYRWLRGDAAGSWAMIVPAFWVLHSFNTSDNMNGLAGGIAWVGVLVMLLAATLGLGTNLPTLACATQLGALTAFLIANYPRGRVFLGDSGSLLLGTWFAGVFLEQQHPAFLLVGALPMADLVTVAWLRWRAGRRPWVGDRAHVSHRLARLGVGEGWAVAFLILAQLPWTLSTLFLLAATGRSSSWPWIVTLLALTLACAATLAVGTARWPRRLGDGT